MLKSYLQYSSLNTFGVICSHPTNIVVNAEGEVMAGALEKVNIWNVREGKLIKTLYEPPEGSIKRKSATVTKLCLSSDNYHLAVGYSDGHIAIWNTESQELITRFTGHKSEVTALHYNSDNSLLVSGSKDTTIVVWDVIAEKGLFRLHGHKNVITEVLFLENTNALVSSSKDMLIKVWDLHTKHCIQTIIGQSTEITSIAKNPQETRLIAVCSTKAISVYTILTPKEIEEKAQKAATEKTEKTIEDISQLNSFERIIYWGNIDVDITKMSEPLSRVSFTSDGSIFAVQSTGKRIDFFHVRSQADVLLKQKKRKKKNCRKK